ncbi:MAG: peptide chain release factor N(5)-glutamine methyltransferase [Chlorobium sp.]|jgi:release factor glutamine methyltransferase|uniref:peptide chain release factor N(5)-glutamine methyltransferase n=1 Tax=Chlorobium sp. TaxID=1095 RepID=UPI001D7078BC|nr:peptide chain release factor N(5)-glutamine methyltransferase [Chlorobium sp.]MBN1278195.1 peptide chain release factor N(5)-glutamine methyltransferase [Chlorobiaceae bacterium]MCF8215630.1 peptide chain release factor N(5)-glutamine methyltransferase [Chlorobium sp.]MCF8270685.1 peptide chain release factor N(5)-glutamine methyltransferase [Chlorobium sp.]MCF8286839.1 peptide chain release factor N(5)-glutamine methyltransferase [Chlorobium sp.]MCF8290585.1 peptide chain release factor N(
MNPEQEKQWSIVDLLKKTTGFFIEKQVDEPRLSAEMLLSHLLGQNRLWLYLNHSRMLSAGELAAFRALCRQRLEGRPVQYITGEQYFYGKPFFVDERVLIPRPETELLVEHASALLDARKGLHGDDACRVLDIGTGSGCIAVTLAALNGFSLFTAMDRSAPALEVARANAETFDVLPRITFLEADMFDVELASRFDFPFDMIVSNPPYIPEEEWPGLQKEVKGFEPREALVTPGGTASYLAICRIAIVALKPCGVLCMEIHAEGAVKVRAIMESAGFTGIMVIKDYSGNDRIISGRVAI